jgi:hypothetical protein
MAALHFTNKLSHTAFTQQRYGTVMLLDELWIVLEQHPGIARRRPPTTKRPIGTKNGAAGSKKQGGRMIYLIVAFQQQLPGCLPAGWALMRLARCKIWSVVATKLAGRPRSVADHSGSTTMRTTACFSNWFCCSFSFISPGVVPPKRCDSNYDARY